MNESSRKRESKFEILRIVAILMIISHHFSVHGIFHMSSDTPYLIWAQCGSLANKTWTCLLYPGGQIGVAVFFMLTGYFLIDRRYTLSSIKKIFICASFYGILTVIAFLTCKIRNIGFTYIGDYPEPVSVIHYLLNPISASWWFVTSYILLALLSPVLNGFCIKLNNKGLRFFIIATWFFLYSLDSMGAQFFYLYKAIFFYLLGGHSKYVKLIRIAK